MAEPNTRKRKHFALRHTTSLTEFVSDRKKRKVERHALANCYKSPTSIHSRSTRYSEEIHDETIELSGSSKQLVIPRKIFKAETKALDMHELKGSKRKRESVKSTSASTECSLGAESRTASTRLFKPASSVSSHPIAFYNEVSGKISFFEHYSSSAKSSVNSSVIRLRQLASQELAETKFSVKKSSRKVKSNSDKKSLSTNDVNLNL